MDVGIPSVTGFLLGDERGFSYYSSPWEAEADKYGNVVRTEDDYSDPWTEEDGSYNIIDLLYAIPKYISREFK